MLSSNIGALAKLLQSLQNQVYFLYL